MSSVPVSYVASKLHDQTTHIHSTRAILCGLLRKVFKKATCAVLFKDFEYVLLFCGWDRLVCFYDLDMTTHNHLFDFLLSTTNDLIIKWRRYIVFSVIATGFRLGSFKPPGARLQNWCGESSLVRATLGKHNLIKITSWYVLLALCEILWRSYDDLFVRCTLLCVDCVAFFSLALAMKDKCFKMFEMYMPSTFCVYFLDRVLSCIVFIAIWVMRYDHILHYTDRFFLHHKVLDHTSNIYKYMNWRDQCCSEMQVMMVLRDGQT